MPDAAPRITVYSCHFGQYEPFNPEATGQAGDHARVVFTDHGDLAEPGVVFRPGVEVGGDARRQSRLAKMRPHLFFGAQDHALLQHLGDADAPLAVAAVEDQKLVARLQPHHLRQIARLVERGRHGGAGGEVALNMKTDHGACISRFRRDDQPRPDGNVARLPCVGLSCSQPWP